jgi:hypothetical protein
MLKPNYWSKSVTDMAGKHNIKRLSTTYHWFSFNNETYYRHFSAVRSVFVTDHNYILTMSHDALQTCNCRQICVFVCAYVYYQHILDIYCTPANFDIDFLAASTSRPGGGGGIMQ